jgi:5'-nucleotidase / UDP-sugar diphosphatase
MRRPAILAVVLAIFVGAGLVTAQSPQTVALTILHTNDTHGHLRPFSYPSIVQPGSELEGLKVRTNIGGIARRATLVRQVREAQKAKGITTWLVDVGDYSDGSPFSTEYHGEADVAAMNAVGYDFATLGNHEFNGPLAQLQKLIGLAKYPLLCANATLTASGRRLLPASRVETVNGVRIGLFGLITREAGTYQAGKEGVAIADEVKTAAELSAALHKVADIVVLLSHAGERVDEQIAAAVPDIDVIVGGHSHSRLPMGVFAPRSEDLKAADVNGTIIVQAHQWGGELGRLDLLFEKDPKEGWKVDRYRARLLPVTNETAEDPAVAAVVDKFWTPIAGKYGEVMGTAADDFSTRGDDEAAYNLVADAVRETLGTDFDLENTGGVRAPLVKGPITKDDLVTMDPFENTVVKFTITGRDLAALLVRFTPAVSGIRYRVEGGQLKEATVGGKPLEEGRTYSGSTNSYLATQAKISGQDTGQSRLAVVAAYIKGRGTVQPAYDGRRVVVRR